VRLEFIPQGFIYLASTCGHNLCKTQRGHLEAGNKMAVFIKVIERMYQNLTNASLHYESSTLRPSVKTVVGR